MNKKAKKSLKRKMNSMMRMKKSQISTSSKTITKTLKESGKYVNTTKKYNKIREGSQTCKNKETKFQTRSKPLTTNSWSLRNNLRFIKRKSYSKSINFLSHCQSKPLKSSIWLISTTKEECQKILPTPFFSKRKLSRSLVTESKSWKEKRSTLRRSRGIWTRNCQSWLKKWPKPQTRLSRRERITRRSNCWNSGLLSNSTNWNSLSPQIKCLIWEDSTKNNNDRFPIG